MEFITAIIARSSGRRAKALAQKSMASGQAAGFSSELAFSSGLIGMHWALNDTAKRFVDVIGNKFKWTVAPSPKGPAGRFQFLGGSAFANAALSR